MRQVPAWQAAKVRGEAMIYTLILLKYDTSPQAVEMRAALLKVAAGSHALTLTGTPIIPELPDRPHTESVWQHWRSIYKTWRKVE
jgi:hypothetical protein